MFDNNRDIKVGRDINIQIDKYNLENLNKQDLLKKEGVSKLILNKEFKMKLKQLFYSMVFGAILFILVYFGLSYLLDHLRVEENTISSQLLRVLRDKNIVLILSGLAAFKTIMEPLLSLGKKNDIEKKHSEILKTIRIILKEKEYLENEK